MKKLSLLVLLMMVVAVTTGCIKSVARFEADGSGQLEIGFNLSVQSLQEAGEQSGGDVDDISPLLDGEVITDEATGINVSAEERLENGSMWTYIQFGVPDVALWGKLGAVAEEALPADDDEALPTDPSSLASIPVVTITDTTIRVEMTIPSSFDPDAEEDPFGMASLLGAFIQISYEIDMPGELIDHNGQIDTLTGNPVWLIDPTNPDDLVIFAESTLE